MNTKAQIKNYIESLTEAKRNDINELHRIILDLKPKSKLWFLNGKDEQGKIVSNPNIGYGEQTIKYADGKTKDFYQIGISSNKVGISVYLIGLDDKQYLLRTFGKKIGNASISSYCIKFKTLKEINIEILKEAISYSFKQRKTS